MMPLQTWQLINGPTVLLSLDLLRERKPWPFASVASRELEAPNRDILIMRVGFAGGSNVSVIFTEGELVAGTHPVIELVERRVREAVIALTDRQQDRLRGP